MDNQQHEGTTTPPSSPKGSNPSFLIPSPIPTRRTRTVSTSAMAAAGPTLKGFVKEFCRYKGHGFITPTDSSCSSDDLFVHISDIDGEYVPKPGDEVTYKKCLIPPKNEKFCAVHVAITHMVPGETHERWDSPSPKRS